MTESPGRSLWRRRATLAAIIFHVLLTIGPWIDLARCPPEAIRGPKRLWYLALLLNGIAPLIWYLWRRQLIVLGVAPSAYLALGRRWRSAPTGQAL